MKLYIELLGLAKSRIDNGFSQVGKRLSADDPAHRALMLLASRAVAVSNALMVLSMQNHANEGLPLLRSLLQLAVEARWIAEKDSAARAADLFERHKDAEWDRIWSSAQLRERMKHLGFQKALEESALMSCYDHLHGNAQGLPWGHVFAAHARPGVSGEDALRAAAAIMGHVVKALDLHWPEKFPGAEQFWERTL
jgi:hypothetical protein